MRHPLALLLLSLLPAAACWASVEANQASEAELDGIRGIGPGLSQRILQERQKAPFRDWGDFIGRVGGVGPASATRLSTEGLTVNGEGYRGRAARPPAGATPGASAAIDDPPR